MDWHVNITSARYPHSSLTQNQLTNDNFQFGQQQQQQHVTLQEHNPSLQSIIQSIDVRNELQSSRNSVNSQPLPIFRADDQILSGTDNIQNLQSQFQNFRNIPQNIGFQSNIQNNAAEVGFSGGASIQRGTLLGMTLGEIINPGTVNFQVGDDVSLDDSNFQLLNGNSVESEEFNNNFRPNDLGSASFIGTSQGIPSQPQTIFVSNPQVVGVSLPQQVLNIRGTGQLNGNLRLNNLGSSAFVGSSRGIPTPQDISVSNPEVLGVSLPQPVSVSLPRTLTEVNQNQFILSDDISLEDLQADFIRTSRSQNIDSASTNALKTQNSLKSLEKMLENSFGPDIPNKQTPISTTGLVKTPDMSSLPLEKHSGSVSSLFPPFSKSKQQPTSIRQAILK